MEKDFKAGFYIKHMVKDLKIASTTAVSTLKVFKDVLEMY
jgi:3-hydroxyisobutyrate dehydrogenase